MPTLRLRGYCRRNAASVGQADAAHQSGAVSGLPGSCARHASSICAESFRCGFSAATGLCGTRLIDFPRTRRRSRSLDSKQIASLKPDFAPASRAPSRQQPQNRQRDGALAFAAGSHQADDFAFADFQTKNRSRHPDFCE